MAIKGWESGEISAADAIRISGLSKSAFYERTKGYLRKKYTNVSFNINVLMLDYSSEIFRNFSEYGINTLSFPCSPYDYLGNMVNFTCSEDSESRTSIDYKRNEFMRETLYPWLPNNALIQPYIFYRLSETIRDTLIWHSIICSKSQA